MTTTPEDPRPDQPERSEAPAAEVGTPAADDTAPAGAPAPATPAEPAPATPAAPGAADTVSMTPVTDDTAPLTPAGDTAPLTPAGDTAPLPPAASGPAPAVPTAPAAPAQPSYPYPHPYGGGYPGPSYSQPYTGPAYPQQPQQQYPAQYPAQPAQPYGYGPRPIGQQPYAGSSPYPPAQQPYATAGAHVAGPHAGAVPPTVPPAGSVPPGTPGPDGQPAGAVATKHRNRAWLPVVATLVIVVLLAVAAVAISTHWPRTGSEANSSGPQSTSIANIGQGGAGTVPVAGSTVENPNWAAVASAVQGAVVAIDVQTGSGEALGSGVVVDAQGHVVTNNHVVDGVQGSTVQVTLADGRIYDANIAGTDASTDLAVVTLKNPPSDLTVAQFGNSDDVKVGDPVMAVGNPLGLSNTVTTGIVSAVDRPVSPQTETGTEEPVTNALQIDAAVNPGNSGGPLFNVQGQVVGITSSIATTSSDSGSIGLGFAIPVNLVNNVAQQLIANGSAQHAYLGVSLQAGTATADGVTRRGAEVTEVQSGSPAESAGLKVGDVVVAINDKPVGGSDSLAAYVRAMSSGDKATLILVRDGKSLTVDVTLATRPDSASQATPDQNGGSSNGGSGNDNGMPGNLQNMTPEQLWEWLQQHQGQGSQSTPGNNQG